MVPVRSWRMPSPRARPTLPGSSQAGDRVRNVELARWKNFLQLEKMQVSTIHQSGIHPKKTINQEFIQKKTFINQEFIQKKNMSFHPKNGWFTLKKS